jgi:anti-anti-sigma factor
MTSHPAPELRLSVESDDTVHVVRLEGELDLTTRDALAAALTDLPKPPRIVVADFSALTFVDSTGLKTILEEHRRARAEQYEFVIAGAYGAVRDTLRLTALDLTLPLVDDVAAVRE